MNIHFYILGLIGVLELALAVWFLVKYKRTPAIIWYVIFVFGVAGWVLANCLLYFSHEHQYIIQKLTWYPGVLISASFLLFSRYFPFSVSGSKKSDLLYFFIPAIFFFFVIFFSKNFITAMDYSYYPAKMSFGSLFFLFPLFFFSYWFYSIYQLAIKFRKSDGIHRRQLKLLLWGICLSFIFASTFDIIFNWLGITGYEMVGSESSIFWLGFSSYIILKKG